MMGNTSAEYQTGLAAAIKCIEGGRVSDAEVILKELQGRFPSCDEALNLLSMLSVNKMEFAEAEKLLRRAIEIKQDNAVYRCNLGNVLNQLGRTDLAIQEYLSAIKITPHFADPYFNLGNVFAANLEPLKAIENYNMALRYKPNWVSVFINRGNVFSSIGVSAAAITDFSDAIRLVPREPGLYLSRARMYFHIRRYDLALLDGRAGLAMMHEKQKGLSPLINTETQLLSELQNLIAEVFMVNGQSADALRELTLDPSVLNTRGFLLLGAAYSESGMIKQAIAALEKSLQLDERNYEALGLIGQCYLLTGEIRKSIPYSKKAVALCPDLVLAIENQARGHFLCGETEEALAVNESIPFAKRSLARSFQYKQFLSEWSGYTDDLRNLNLRLNSLSGVEAVEESWSLFSVLDNPWLIQSAARRFFNHKILPSMKARISASRPLLTRVGAKRIKVGYFSPDFKHHVVAHLIRKLFTLHSQKDFEVYLFSYGRASGTDAVRERLEQENQHFIEIAEKSDDEIVAIARTHEIDVAIDLAGAAGDGRAGLFALRLAPIQVSYLGYAGTTGSPWHDYIIADPTVAPPEHLDAFTEKVVHLPCFMPYDTDIDNSRVVLNRAEHGLPAGGFIFCCFNNNFKITPIIFDAWMRILKQVPGSCLWLKKVSPAVEGRLLSYAEGAGIKRNRIIFAGRMDSLKDHMARYQLADLALDTYPYNGHATSMDALWMGLPVLSVLGAAMHARVSASLLRSVQLDDLIAKDIEAYEKKAVELAQDPEKLKSVKSKLDSAHKKGDVFPMVKYTKSLEQAYRVMVERYRAGRPPDHIEIKG